MAFTESWIETEPDGGVHTVSQADDYIRLKGRALRERVEGDPAVLGSGVFESGTFAATAMVKKGVARAFTITNADQSTTYLQDGRLAVNTDTNVLYHSRTSGLVALGVAPIAHTFVNGQTFGKNNHFTAVLGTNEELIQLTPTYAAAPGGAIYITPALNPGAGVITNAAAIIIADTAAGAGASVTTLYALRIEDQTRGTTNYAIHTGLGHVRFGGQVQLPDGTAGGPFALVFESATSVGFYKRTAGIGIIANGVEVFVQTGGVHVHGGPLNHQYDGSSSDCAYTWNGDANTGLYRVGADQMNLVAGGQSSVQLLSTGVRLFLLPGDAGSPAIAFLTDTDLGFYRVAAEKMGFVGSQIQASDGSATDPLYSFVTKPAMGMYRGGDELRFANSGLKVQIPNSAPLDGLAISAEAYSGGLKSILYGAADSGGAGYKLLRIAN